MAGLISEYAWKQIRKVKKKMRDTTVDVVTVTETKTADDIYQVATRSEALESLPCQFYWAEDINNRWDVGGRLEDGDAICVIAFEDADKISGDNIFLRRDSKDLRIERVQKFPNEREVIVNLKTVR